MSTQGSLLDSLNPDISKDVTDCTEVAEGFTITWLTFINILSPVHMAACLRLSKRKLRTSILGPMLLDKT